MTRRAALALLMLGLGWGTATAADTAVPEIRVLATHPSSAGAIGRDQAFYVRLRYRSAVPIRVQAHGYLGGAEVKAAARFNPSPAYPAGEGEAVAWIAYGEPTRLDQIRVEVADAGWRPLLSARMPVAAAWSEAPPLARSEPEWVTRLSGAQQDAMRQAATPSDVFDPVVMLLLYATPAYIVLQVVLGLWFSGAWRIAALVPLAAMVPIGLYSATALAAGSNLWPILFIFVAPLACLYLLAIAGVRLIRTL